MSDKSACGQAAFSACGPFADDPHPLQPVGAISSSKTHSLSESPSTIESPDTQVSHVARGCVIADAADDCRMSSIANASSNVLDSATVERLRVAVARHGVAGAARIAGVDRTVIARGLAGLGLRNGTILLLRTNLANEATS